MEPIAKHKPGRMRRVFGSIYGFTLDSTGLEYSAHGPRHYGSDTGRLELQHIVDPRVQEFRDRRYGLAAVVLTVITGLLFSSALERYEAYLPQEAGLMDVMGVSPDVGIVGFCAALMGFLWWVGKTKLIIEHAGSKPFVYWEWGRSQTLAHLGEETRAQLKRLRSGGLDQPALDEPDPAELPPDMERRL